MNLKEFVSATLIEIAEGVSEAKPAVKGLGGNVNPGSFSQMSQIKKQIVNVEFDVSLANNATDSTGKGIGVLLSIISAGANKTSEAEIKSLTRIKFVVPVDLP